MSQVELISLWSSWRGDRPALLEMRVEEVHYTYRQPVKVVSHISSQQDSEN